MAIAREAEPVSSLTEVREFGLDREDLLDIYRHLLTTRGIEERGHILYKQGKIPGSFYTGRGNEASAVGIATAMGPEDVGTPLHRDMGVHVVRGVEPWRIFAQFMGRIDGPTQGQGRQRPHGRRPPRADRHGQPPAGDAPRRRRLRARLPDPGGEARRPRLVRRRRLRPRRHARGDEPRRRPPPPDRLHLRQQPVGLLDADAPRVRDRAHRRPCQGLRLRRRRRRRHGRPRRLPGGQAGRREGARGRWPDADRVPDPPHGGPRGARRRLLRPQGDVRGVGEARSPRALPQPGSARTPTSRTSRRTRSAARSRSS